MPLRSDWSDANCPIARGLDVLGDPWSVLVLREIFIGNRRFDGLRRELGVADNVLTARLKKLLDAGLLDRRPYGPGPRPRQEYVLTEAGADVLPVLHAVAGWADRHTVSPTGRPMSISCGVCGTVSESADHCSGCGGALTVATTVWERPTPTGHRVVLNAALGAN